MTTLTCGCCSWPVSGSSLNDSTGGYSGYGHQGIFCLENSRSVRYICHMKPWGRFCVIFVAYALALLHTAVPHHHQTVHEGQVISSTTCCPPVADGVLGRALSTDLGTGHLETFKTESPLELSHPLGSMAAAYADEKFTLPVVIGEPVYQNSPINLLKQRRLLFSTTSFRGPPQLA